ncbi:hypothetical protein GALL_444780 [mine drainage metagenome]|uniref:Uncharacterized protein n=1 Tax=mine drainage metagenome TaxID=410659 RepID=A0A1J5PRW2_9ZZZZ
MAESFGHGQLPAKSGHRQGSEQPAVLLTHADPMGRGQHTGTCGDHDHDPEHQTFTGVAAAAQAPQNGRERIANGGCQYRQPVPADEAIHAGAQCHYHPRHAGQQGPPVRARHTLAKDRCRQQRDQDRGHKKQRIGVGQGQLLQAMREQREHGNGQHAAQQVQRPAHAPQRVPAAAPLNPQYHQRQRHPATQCRHL